jgi:RNase P subunit RPR2
MPEVKRCPCPNCNYNLEAATAARGKDEPRPDDYSVCFNCGAVLRFNQDMTVRLCLDKDVEEQWRPAVMQVANLIRAKGNAN